jgi:hypothetical protein
MRTFLLILTTALLTALGIIYAWTNNLFPQVFSLLPMPYYGEQIAAEDSAVPTWAACTTPWWDRIAHGEMILSFAAESWTISDEGCQAFSSYCLHGQRWGDTPARYESCQIENPGTCEVNWFVFAHGTSHEFFAQDPENETCLSQDRTCTDGEVDGDETYIYLGCPSGCAAWDGTCPACDCAPEDSETESETQDDEEQEETPSPSTTTTTTTVTSSSSSNSPSINQISQPTTTSSSANAQPNCPAPFGWSRREPWQQGTAYASQTARFDSSCEQVSIVCAYGSIRFWTREMPWAVAVGISQTCSVAEPIWCTSACGQVDHGDQVTTYQMSQIPHGNGQVCSDIRIVSTCTDGTLFPAWWSACSCEVAPPLWCTAPNGQNVAHGASLTLFQAPQVQATSGDGSSSCVWEWRQCLNGDFVDQAWSPASFSYQHPSCTVVPAN